MASTDFGTTRERRATTLDGGLFLLGVVVLAGGIAWTLLQNGGEIILALGAAPLIVVAVLLLGGFYLLQPNEAAVITLFGNYKGTDRRSGLRWIWPWYRRKKVSLRVRNVTSQTLKVNDKRGNPIEIAAVVVWRIKDTAHATFDVEDPVSFVNIQMETALREIASHFAYDHSEEHEPTLRADGDKVAELLRERLRERVEVAGVAVDETKLSHLAYAPEIAGSMLRRQQAEAILAARQKIVAGAVTMVETALAQLEEREVVKFDGTQRAQMVSNLLVVLCADREAQPVVNTGATQL